MQPAPLILLPPSEGKSAGGDGAPLDLDSLSFPLLNPTRARMAKALVQLSERPLSSKRVLGVKGPALEKAMAENGSIETSPTLSAIYRYTGVMYDAIDYDSLEEHAAKAFNRTVVVMSGLFGMVRVGNMIPAYKLKMGATIMRKKTCAAVWKPLNSKALTADGKRGVIWDLLPLEHSAAWDPDSVPHEARFKAKFVERGAGGQLKTVTHLSKLLKGSLVRHLVSNIGAAGSKEAALELVAGFEHPEGYVLDPMLTSETDSATELVFARG